jgi:hypothetical protein
MSDDDRSERERVYARIAGTILQFQREHPTGTFHVEELREYVTALAPDIAPDSPGRILRLLREEGKLNYVVISRSASLYQFRSVEPKPPAAPQSTPPARLPDSPMTLDLFDE